VNAEFTIAKSGEARISSGKTFTGRANSFPAHLTHLTSLAALLLFMSGGAVSHAASAPANTPARGSGSVSNAPSYNTESIFTIPNARPEGKDPFFPKSEYPYQHAKPAATNTYVAPAVPQTVDLKLSGISGTSDHRLCIINGKTLEQGEEREVPVGPARINIRVLKIEVDTVTVQVGTQQQVLHLRRF
jgi:hypothetical protein